jgi:hypothetical protein
MSLQRAEGVGEKDSENSPRITLLGAFNCPPHRTLKINDTTTSLNNFINATLSALGYASEEVTGEERPISFLARNYDKYPSIKDGFWAEFGVFQGSTLQLAHKELSTSKHFQGTIAGFDSFEGLPEVWRKGFDEGFFAISERQYDEVRSKLSHDVGLYKGWFQETIPVFKTKYIGVPASVIHHDGDLFISTTITLQLRSDRIWPGTHMIFDELVGYPGFEKHEILALWLWMAEHDALLCAMGHAGPVDKSDVAWANPKKDVHPSKQSAWLQVLTLAAAK